MICRFNAIWIKIPESYFTDVEKLILKLMWRSERLRMTNTILKKNKVRELVLPLLVQESRQRGVGEK